MKIQTRYHGEVEAVEKDIWQFPKGIPGFQDEREFFLYPLAEEEVFFVLQSTKEPDIAFVVSNPFSFFQAYDFTLDESSIETLQLEKAEDVQLFVILTLGETIETSTANLQAPIVLNVKNHRAKQVILHDTQYKTKHPINQEVKKG